MITRHQSKAPFATSPRRSPACRRWTGTRSTCTARRRRRCSPRTRLHAPVRCVNSVSARGCVRGPYSRAPVPLIQRSCSCSCRSVISRSAACSSSSCFVLAQPSSRSWRSSCYGISWPHCAGRHVGRALGRRLPRPPTSPAHARVRRVAYDAGQATHFLTAAPLRANYPAVPKTCPQDS